MVWSHAASPCSPLVLTMDDQYACLAAAAAAPATAKESLLYIKLTNILVICAAALVSGWSACACALCNSVVAPVYSRGWFCNLPLC
jgi:hypothetical protein